MPELYKDELLEHYREPQNFGELEDADILIDEHNTSCGDYQKWTAKIKNGNTIEEIKFKGDGCVVSTTAASLLSELVKNKSLEEIQHMTQQDMEKLIGMKVSPARINCLMFPLKAIQKGINELNK